MLVSHYWPTFIPGCCNKLSFFPLCCSLVFRFFLSLLIRLTGKMCFVQLQSSKSDYFPPRQHSHELELPYFFFLSTCRHSPLKLVIWRFNFREWSVYVHLGLSCCVFRLMTSNCIMYILCKFMIIITCLSD